MMSWREILKARVPSKRGREARELARRIPIPEFKEFDFKKEYSFDEFYPLLDNDDQRKIMRMLKGAHGLMSESYRLSVMTEKDKKALRRREEMPKPFTLDEIKDRISFKLIENGREPQFSSSMGRLTIKLPLSKSNQEEVVSNALDELYAKFRKNEKQLSRKELGEKWYQEHRRAGRQPDYDATKEERAEFAFNVMFG